MHQLREHRLNMSKMCIVLIDWFMILVFLVLKIFASSHPMNFKGVLTFYVLLFHEGQAEYYLLCFLYARNKHINFNALLCRIFCLCYFSCCNIVAKFTLLEFYLSCLCLDYFDLSLQFFYIMLIKIVLASCHLKNYFVITYLLEDEQELSLGMFDTSQTYL